VSRVFRIAADEALGAGGVLKRLEHRFGLPGLACEACGRTWSMTGPSFPEIALPHDVDPQPFLEPAPVSVARMRELTEMVRPLVPAGTALYPGTTLGPAWATASRPKVALDFVFFYSWTLLSASPKGAAALDDCGVTNVRVELKGKATLDLREASLPMFGLLDDMVDRTQTPTPCEVCGYEKLRVPEVLRLALPASAGASAEVPAIFRAANAPTVMLATERFADVVQERSLKGITFIPVDRK
jgi:uncharacterized double-CXXCG motif protein